MSMWATLGKLIAEPIIVRMPGFIMNRIYPHSRLESAFEIDLRSGGGLAVLNTAPPSLAGNLRMTNHLPFEVRIDRCTFEIWFGQPNCEVTLRESFSIPGHSTNNGVFFKAQLSEAQLKQAKSVLDHPLFGYVYLYGVAECDVGFTKFKKSINLQRTNYEIVSMAQYRSAPTFEDSVATEAPVAGTNNHG